MLFRIIFHKFPLTVLYQIKFSKDLLEINYAFKKFSSDHFDKYRKNIDWMMKVNEASYNKVTFNSIPIQTDPNNEEVNNVRFEKISDLLKHIVNSGHEIEFHHPKARTLYKKLISIK